MFEPLEEYAAILARRADYTEEELRAFLARQDYGGLDREHPEEFERFARDFIEAYRQERAELLRTEAEA